MNVIYALQIFDASYNYFTGNFHAGQLSKLAALGGITINNNQFTGNIDRLVAANQTNLYELDISSNTFTSTIPAELFTVPNIEVIILAKNCFTGYLPATICAPKTMSILILDGLHSSQSCPELVEFLDNYLILHPVAGTIPLCLFNMSVLKTLHLSSNGFTGSLPAQLNTLSSLVDLTLSHNLLRGDIPAAILTKAWLNLDLSCNFFSGTLTEAMPSPASNSSISLEDNRLSGYIPSSLIDAENINILEGNLFACQLDESDLRSNDPYYSTFTCGSDDTDRALYVWLSCFVGLFIIPLLIARYNQHFSIQLREITNYLGSMASFRFTNHETVSKLCPNIAKFITMLWQFIVMIIFVCLVAVVILLPVYAALTYLYGTISQQYAWVIAFCFLSGEIPAIVLLVLLMLLLACLIIYSRSMQSVGCNAEQSQTDNSHSTRQRLLTSFSCSRADVKLSLYDAVVITLIVLFNCSLVVGANAAYVYVFSQSKASNVELLFASIALSLFKLIWQNSVVIQVIGSYLRVQQRWKTEAIATFLILLTLFNNIAAPCFAELFISSTCFYYIIIVQPPEVTSNFNVISCVVDTESFLCGALQAASISFLPPFSYSYECSSSLLTSFAYVFIYRYIFSGILYPIVLLLIKYALSVSDDAAPPADNGDSSRPSSDQQLRSVGQQRDWSKIPLLLRISISSSLIFPEAAGSNGDALHPANQTSFIVNHHPVSLHLDQPRESEMKVIERDKQYENTTLNVLFEHKPFQNGDGSYNSSQARSSNDSRSIYKNNKENKLNNAIPSSTQLGVSGGHNHGLRPSIFAMSLAAIVGPAKPVEEIDLEDYFRTSFIVKIISDFSVLMTFGILFPPLAIVIGYSICMEMLITMFMLYRLADPLAFVRESVIIGNRRPISLLMEKVEEECAQIDTILWPNLQWVYWIAALFWAYPLFDTLGDSIGAEHAYWIPLVMSLSPAWMNTAYTFCKLLFSYLLNRFRKETESESYYKNDSNGSQMNNNPMHENI